MPQVSFYEDRIVRFSAPGFLSLGERRLHHGVSDDKIVKLWIDQLFRPKFPAVSCPLYLSHICLYKFSPVLTEKHICTHHTLWLHHPGPKDHPNEEPIQLLAESEKPNPNYQCWGWLLLIINPKLQIPLEISNSGQKDRLCETSNPHALPPPWPSSQDWTPAPQKPLCPCPWWNPIPEVYLRCAGHTALPPGSLGSSPQT